MRIKKHCHLFPLFAIVVALAGAVSALQSGGVQPVDLAQAAIGPGMALFSRGARVLEPDGAEMSVRTALELINKVLDELLGGGVSFDPETSWAAVWFEMYGLEAGPFGEAQTLVRAKNTTLESLSRLGIAQSQEGEVRLQMEGALTSTVWGCLAALLRAFEEGGASAAGVALAGLPEGGREALALAWRLHSVCERKGMSGAAGTYNRFVTAWPEILRQAL